MTIATEGWIPVTVDTGSLSPWDIYLPVCDWSSTKQCTGFGFFYKETNCSWELETWWWIWEARLEYFKSLLPPMDHKVLIKYHLFQFLCLKKKPRKTYKKLIWWIRSMAARCNFLDHTKVKTQMQETFIGGLRPTLTWPRSFNRLTEARQWLRQRCAMPTQKQTRK